MAGLWDRWAFISCLSIAGFIIVFLLLSRKAGLVFNILVMTTGVYLFSEVIAIRSEQAYLTFFTILLIGYNYGQLNRMIYRIMPTFEYVLLTEVFFSIGKALVIRDLMGEVLGIHLFFIIYNLLMEYMQEF